MGQTMGSVMDPSTDDNPTPGMRAAQMGMGALKGGLKALPGMQQPQRGAPSNISVPQAPVIQFGNGPQPQMDDSQYGQQPMKPSMGYSPALRKSNPFYGMQ